jgi:hypothetical protein
MTLNGAKADGFKGCGDLKEVAFPRRNARE